MLKTMYFRFKSTYWKGTQELHGSNYLGWGDNEKHNFLQKQNIVKHSRRSKMNSYYTSTNLKMNPCRLQDKYLSITIDERKP